MLYRQMKIDHVIALNVPNDEIINRLKDRWVHLASGRVYNVRWSPPKVPVSRKKRKTKRHSNFNLGQRRYNR